MRAYLVNETPIDRSALAFALSQRLKLMGLFPLVLHSYSLGAMIFYIFLGRYHIWHLVEPRLKQAVSQDFGFNNDYFS